MEWLVEYLLAPVWVSSLPCMAVSLPGDPLVLSCVGLSLLPVGSCPRLLMMLGIMACPRIPICSRLFSLYRVTPYGDEKNFGVLMVCGVLMVAPAAGSLPVWSIPTCGFPGVMVLAEARGAGCLSRVLRTVPAGVLDVYRVPGYRGPGKGHGWLP